MRKAIWAAAAILLASASAWAVVDKEAAKEHLDMVSAGLQNANNDAKALYTLSSDPKSYSAGHATTLAQDLARQLSMARESLDHLPPLAQGDPEAMGHIAQVRSQLEIAESKAQALSKAAGNTPDQARKASKAAYDDIKKAWDAYDQVTSDFGGSRELLSP